MNPRYSFFFLISFLTLLTGCKQKQLEFNDKYTLSYSSSISFPLDSLSKRDYSIYYKDHNDAYLFMLNRYQNSIYRYNYTNQSIDSILNFKEEGENSVGEIDAFIVKSKDSLYIRNYNRRALYLVNNTKILKKYMFFEADQTRLTPQISNQNKAFINQNKIYFTHTGLRTANKKNTSFPKTTVSNLDLSTGKFDFELAFPDVYKNKVWGSQLLNLTSTLNKKDQIRVYSFMVDDHIITIDAKGKQRRFYAGSKHFSKTPPLSKRENNDIPLRNEVNHLYASPHFSNIYYNPINDMYYRFAFLPKYTIKELKKITMDKMMEVMAEEQISVIILDKNFVKCGEVLLDKLSYDINKLFFTEKGMHILDKNSEEDVLKYDILELKAL